MARIEETIDVDVPVTTAYNQWTQFEKFPEFMEGIERVEQLDDTHLLWSAEIGGKKETWKAEITEQHPDHRVAWKAIEGPKNAGVVTFHQLDEGSTRVAVQMDWEPEGLVEKRIPEGRFARAEHLGSYEGLSDAWARLKEQVFREGGHRIGPRPSYEIYRNTPMTVPKEELRTEIYVPVS